MSCFIRKLVDGFGGLGDGYVCVKCGYSSYYRPCNSALIKNDGTYMHRTSFPFVVKFADEITWSTPLMGFTHFFDRDGKLKPSVLLPKEWKT